MFHTSNDCEVKLVTDGEKTKFSKSGAVKQILGFIGLLLAVLAVGAFGAVTVIFFGPSVTARDLLVTSLNETSAGKPIARIFLSQDKINEILSNNTIHPFKEITNGELITINQHTDDTKKGNGIQIIEIATVKYKAKLMIVEDPSRVYLGTLDEYGENAKGMTLMDMIKRDGAVAGINGGGFVDTAGMGNGGEPLGIVIKNGEIMYGPADQKLEIIGFDENHKLILGYMTGEEALTRGIKDAMSFGPILIVNGESVNVSGTGGGLNPRTAIGQRSDGAILLLVADGRQASSLGASYNDIIGIMLDYGAVNCANLDGGSSTLMVYDGEILNSSASLYGPRQIPTAFLVKGVQDGE